MRRRKPTVIQGETSPELSPLDQIRQAEAEVARQIAAATMAAELAISQANTQVFQMKSQAHESGRHNGLSLYQEIISKAQYEAQELTNQAAQDAQRLRIQGESRMGEAVDWVVKFVLGIQEAEHYEH